MQSSHLGLVKGLYVVSRGSLCHLMSMKRPGCKIIYVLCVNYQLLGKIPLFLQNQLDG